MSVRLVHPLSGDGGDGEDDAAPGPLLTTLGEEDGDFDFSMTNPPFFESADEVILLFFYVGRTRKRQIEGRGREAEGQREADRHTHSHHAHIHIMHTHTSFTHTHHARVGVCVGE